MLVIIIGWASPLWTWEDPSPHPWDLKHPPHLLGYLGSLWIGAWPGPTVIHPFHQPLSQAGDLGVYGLEPCWALRLSHLHPREVSSDSRGAPENCLLHSEALPHQHQGSSLNILLTPTPTPLNLMPSIASSLKSGGISLSWHKAEFPILLPVCPPDSILSLSGLLLVLSFVNVCWAPTMWGHISSTVVMRTE